jgi:hypothetical protein
MFNINSQKRGWGLKRPKGERGGIRISIKYILLTPNNLLFFIQTK